MSRAPPPSRKGSGANPSDVNKLLKEFSNMAGMMQQMAGMNKWQQIRQIKQMADGGLFNPGGADSGQKERDRGQSGR
jgi:signal recognition particle subunit SRP54